MMPDTYKLDFSKFRQEYFGEFREDDHMKYYPMKPGDTVQIVLLNPDQVITLPITKQSVDEKISDVLFQKKNPSAKLKNALKNKPILSRFDILDIR